MTDPDIADTNEEQAAAGDAPDTKAKEPCDCDRCKANPELLKFVGGFDSSGSFARNGELLDKLMAHLKDDSDSSPKALARIDDIMRQFDAARANFVLSVSMKPPSLRTVSPLLQAVVTFSKNLERACFEVGKELMKTEDMPTLLKEAAETIVDTLLEAFKPKDEKRQDDVAAPAPDETGEEDVPPVPSPPGMETTEELL